MPLHRGREHSRMEPDKSMCAAVGAGGIQWSRKSKMLLVQLKGQPLQHPPLHAQAALRPQKPATEGAELPSAASSATAMGRANIPVEIA